jgi:hypothetical protein
VKRIAQRQGRKTTSLAWKIVVEGSAPQVWRASSTACILWVWVKGEGRGEGEPTD